MFGFIKFLQATIVSLKKKKGLFFSILTIASLSGIVLSMFIIMTMTSKVSNEVYSSMSSAYALSIENKINNKKNTFEKNIVMLIENKQLMNAIEKFNVVALKESKDNINSVLYKLGFKDMKVDFFSTADNKTIFRSSVISAINTKNTLHGIEVMKDGTFFIILKPLVKDNLVYGVIELRESINTLKYEFEKQNSNYLFLLNKNMLDKLAVEYKNGKFKDILDDYVIESAVYDTKFNATMSEMNIDNFNKLKRIGYIVDDGYYRSNKIITDINGASIGMIIVGEFTENEGGFVNIADNMTKTITTVALGLVISIILFMF